MINSRIKILAFVEAGTVTGPAKNLIDFCRQAAEPFDEFSCPVKVETVVATFCRPPRRRAATRESAIRLIGDRRAPNPFVAAARKAGLEVHVIDERFRFDAQVIEGMRGVVKRVNPDIIQTHSVKSHFLLKLSGLSAERPWIAFHHGYTDTDVKMRAYNQLDRWSLRFADRIVTVSRAFQRELEAVGIDPERIRVVQNAVDQSRFRSAGAKEINDIRKTLGANDGPRLILSVGRLSREKGHIDLVEAFAKLRRSFPMIGAKLVIVGDGPERQSIENCAAALGVQDRVVLTGQIQDVRPYYLISDVLVLPSHSEGSPNVLLEAMAAGLPVVATRVDGVPEIVTHDETGLLVDAGQSKKMAEAIAMLLADPDLAFRIAEAARSAVALRHSLSLRYRALAGIYRELTPAVDSKMPIRKIV